MSTPASQHTVRQHNRALVLNRIAEADGQTRARVAAATGLTRATVSALVDELIDAGLVSELKPTAGLRGRPGSPLHLSSHGPAGLGIEINIDHTSVCLVDFAGAVQAKRTIATDNAAASTRAGLRRAAKLATSVAAAADRTVGGVALAVPGLVSTLGVLHETPNLPRWAGADVGAVLGELLGRPVLVDNEANLAALAEHWYGSAPRDFIYVSGEVGVGSGLVVDGALVRGVRGYAGELGHVLVDPHGPRCGCGSRGCLEQLAGKQSVLKGARAADDSDLLRLLGTGSKRARDALACAAVALGVALGGAINIVDIPNVVLGGFYARLGERLVEPLRHELTRRVVSRSPVTLIASRLGTDAPMLGAAGTVIRGIRAAAVWPEPS